MNSPGFGGWSIDTKVYLWMVRNLPKGKTVFEIGSGRSTGFLCKKWSVYSLEEDSIWINAYHNQYIHAPIKNNWYDIDILKDKMPNHIDLILVDGPARGDRMGFFNNINLFDNTGYEILVFDDVERQNDYNCYSKVLDHLNQTKKTKTDIIKGYKNFAYIKL